MANWQQYQQFMPEGMASMFQGKYFWKMPADVKMDVGPTVIHPLPKGYMEATEKYFRPDQSGRTARWRPDAHGLPGRHPVSQARLSRIRDGRCSANLWYRYLPHLIVDTYGNGCYLNSTGNVNCEAAQIVNRQLAYNTDPNTPVNYPGAEGKFSSEWLMVLEPEQQRYTAFLTISYTDPCQARGQLHLHALAAPLLSRSRPPRDAAPTRAPIRPRRIIASASIPTSRNSRSI